MGARGGRGLRGAPIKELENRRATVLVFSIGMAALLAGAIAAIAGLCDAAPAVTAALGERFDRFALAVEPYRSLYLFSTVGLLLLGVGFAYLPRVVRVGGAEDIRVGAIGHASLGAASGMAIIALLTPIVASWLVS